LRSFLEDVQRNAPDCLLSIREEVPLDYTATALALALEKLGRLPILLFEKVKGYNTQVVANLCASRELLSRSAGVGQESFNRRFAECLSALVPARSVASGPVHDVIWQEKDADLARLPIPRHFLQDAGPYVTAGMLAARDPAPGVGNLAFVRLQVRGPRTLGASLHSRQHTWDYLRRAEMSGRDLPVAVVIGAHPAIMLAAAAKIGIEQDEYDLAGAFLGGPLEVCRAQTVEVDVPAHAEIVIEGRLLAGRHEPEGPFGEYTGYVSGRSTNNVMEVTAITMRRDALYVDIVPGNSAEHLTLGRVAKEAWVHARMKETLPFYTDLYYPSSGTHYHCYVRINKTEEGQAPLAAQLLLALDHYVKLVVVVDQDIDPRDQDAVLWAMATRMQADRDVQVVSGSLCNALDPSCENGVGAKMLIDATMRKGFDATRIALPPEANALAQTLLAKGDR
jgi:4-hydroxy-3-polyprenylbenzoate decarboxylase